MQGIGDLANLVQKGGKLVVFSGAGISTQSGIPDYRSPGGLWETFKPVTYQEFVSGEDGRRRYWEYYRLWLPDLAAARPNPGHLALGRLYRAGKLKAVITQNVDGLHAAGGVPPEAVVELHGNALWTSCLNACGYRVSTGEVVKAFIDGGPAPSCPRCGGHLKPTTISYGQSLDPGVLERAAVLAREADPLLVVGSSLTVTPAAELPLLTLDAGGGLAVINRDPTPLDYKADVVMQVYSAEALEALAHLVGG